MKNWKMLSGIVIVFLLAFCYWGGQYFHNYVENLAQEKAEMISQKKIAEANEQLWDEWQNEATRRMEGLIGKYLESFAINCELQSSLKCEIFKGLVVKQAFEFLIENSNIPKRTLKIDKSRKNFFPTQCVLILDENLLFEKYESKKGYILEKFKDLGNRAMYIGEGCGVVLVYFLEGPHKGEFLPIAPKKIIPAQSALVYSSSDK